MCQDWNPGAPLPMAQDAESMDLLPEGRSLKKLWQEAILLRGGDHDGSFPVSPT